MDTSTGTMEREDQRIVDEIRATVVPSALLTGALLRLNGHPDLIGSNFERMSLLFQWLAEKTDTPQERLLQMVGAIDCRLTALFDLLRQGVLDDWTSRQGAGVGLSGAVMAVAARLPLVVDEKGPGFDAEMFLADLRAEEQGVPSTMGMSKAAYVAHINGIEVPPALMLEIAAMLGSNTDENTATGDRVELMMSYLVYAKDVPTAQAADLVRAMECRFFALNRVLFAEGGSPWAAAKLRDTCMAVPPEVIEAAATLPVEGEDSFRFDPAKFHAKMLENAEAVGRA